MAVKVAHGDALHCTDKSSSNSLKVHSIFGIGNCHIMKMSQISHHCTTVVSGFN